MISEKDQPVGSLEDWYQAASTILTKIAKKGRKVTIKEITKQVKEGNYELISGCVQLDDINALVQSPNRPEDPEDKTLKDLVKVTDEAEQLRLLVEAEPKSETLQETARELIIEAIKLKVGLVDLDHILGVRKLDKPQGEDPRESPTEEKRTT